MERNKDYKREMFKKILREHLLKLNKYRSKQKTTK